MQVQDQIAQDTMQQFHLPLSVSVIQKARDWPTRQKIAYEAIKGHLRDDFHGLEDFREQMEMYSSSNLILKTAWKLIKGLAPVNRKILKTLVTNSQLGQVGKFLLTLQGFDRVFAVSIEADTNTADVQRLLSS
jgi:hypothetical protein